METVISCWIFLVSVYTQTIVCLLFKFKSRFFTMLYRWTFWWNSHDFSWVIGPPHDLTFLPWFLFRVFIWLIMIYQEGWNFLDGSEFVFCSSRGLLIITHPRVLPVFNQNTLEYSRIKLKLKISWYLISCKNSTISKLDTWWYKWAEIFKIFSK